MSDFALLGSGESSDDTNIASTEDDLKIMPAAPGLPDKESDGQQPHPCKDLAEAQAAVRKLMEQMIEHLTLCYSFHRRGLRY